MNLEILRVPPGAKHKKKRVGRGPSSGHGKTSTRGHKGQKSRGSGKIRPWFEGGQMPITRRLPKRGFRPLSRKSYEIVNVGDLNIFDADTQIDPILLRRKGLVKKGNLIKILGKGRLIKPLHVKAHSFSSGAKEAIQKAGGVAEIIKC